MCSHVQYHVSEPECFETFQFLFFKAHLCLFGGPACCTKSSHTEIPRMTVARAGVCSRSIRQLHLSSVSRYAAQPGSPPDLLQATINKSLEKLENRILKRAERNSPKSKKNKGAKTSNNSSRSPSKQYRGSVSLSSSSYTLTASLDHKYDYDTNTENPILKGTLSPDSTYVPIELPNQDPVPTLSHKLSRVIFSPGVHYLQDPRTKVFNFNPYLKNILPVKDFDFEAITTFVSASKDTILSGLAKEHKLKYYGSTSSMTGVLSHMHFLLSNFRPASLKDISHHHADQLGRPTKGAKLPATVIIRKNVNGCYSVDSDKSADREMVLSLLGHSLERFLTKTPEEYEQYKKTEESKTIIESNTYHYAKLDDFLMRSQLDCYDSRLPGTGTFDLKTRAVAGVRHDLARVEKNSTGYRLVRTHGLYESFEREMLDLARSTMLKYSLQARIGNMDGIFIAYHNIAKMFGFQYLPLSKMDEVLHSVGRPHVLNMTTHKLEKDPTMVNQTELTELLASKQADEEFKISIKLWNTLLDEITSHYIPHDSFRMSVCAIPVSQFETKLRVVATKISEDEIHSVQKSGERLQALMVKAVEDEHQEILDSHLKSMKKLNDSLRHSPIAFDVYVRTNFNGRPSSQRHPTLLSMDSKWGVGVKVVELNQKDAADFYNHCLSAKLSMLEYSSSVKDDDEASSFINVLRAFGKKGEMVIDDVDEPIVWNEE